MCWASNLVRPRRLQLVPIEQHEVLSPLWLTCYSVYDRLRQAESWFGLAAAFAPLAFGARGNAILLGQSLNMCLMLDSLYMAEFDPYHCVGSFDGCVWLLHLFHLQAAPLRSGVAHQQF